MAKKSLSSRKSLKGFFSKSEVNLESAEKDEDIIVEKSIEVAKKRVSAKKSFKGLFSNANLEESVQKNDDKHEGGKKFKLPKFKKKTKTDTAVKLEENISAAEVQLQEAEDLPKTISHGTKTSPCDTAPTSKIKDLSYSELDLRKPRKFGTFTFGLKKKKKKNRDEDLSKSIMGLHSPEVQAQEGEEDGKDLSTWELEQSRQVRFAMSHPEPDSGTFITPATRPMPPNQSQSLELLIDSPDLAGATGLAPTATVPELQWEEPIVSVPGQEEEESQDDDQDNSDHATYNPYAPAVWTNATSVDTDPPFIPTPPNFPPSPPPTTANGAEIGTAFAPPPFQSFGPVNGSVSSVSPDPVLPVREISPNKTDRSVTEASHATFSIGQPETDTSSSISDNSVPNAASSSTNGVAVPVTLTSVSTDDNSVLSAISSSTSDVAVPAVSVSESYSVPVLNIDPPISSVVTETEEPTSSFVTETHEPISSVATETHGPISSVATEPADRQPQTAIQLAEDEDGGVATSGAEMDATDSAVSNTDADPTARDAATASPASPHASLYGSLPPEGLTSSSVTSAYTPDLHEPHAPNAADASTPGMPVPLDAGGVSEPETDTSHIDDDVSVAGLEDNVSEPDLGEPARVVDGDSDRPVQRTAPEPILFPDGVYVFTPLDITSPSSEPDDTDDLTLPRLVVGSGATSVVPSGLALPSHPAGHPAEPVTPPEAETTTAGSGRDAVEITATENGCHVVETTAAERGGDAAEITDAGGGEATVETLAAESGQHEAPIAAAGRGGEMEAAVMEETAGEREEEVERGEEASHPPDERGEGEEGKEAEKMEYRQAQTGGKGMLDGRGGRGEEEVGDGGEEVGDREEEVGDGGEERGGDAFPRDGDAGRPTEAGATEEWSPVKEGEEEEEEAVPVLPAQRVRGFMECEWVPPSSGQHGEEDEEEEEGNWSARTHTFRHTHLGTAARPDTHTQPPGQEPSIEGEERQSMGVEQIHTASGDTLGEDTPTHTADSEIPLDQHTPGTDTHAANVGTAGARTTGRSTHTDRLDSPVTRADSEDAHTPDAVRETVRGRPASPAEREETATDTLAQRAELASGPLTRTLESNANPTEEEHARQASRAWAHAITERASGQREVPEEVVVKLSLADTHTPTVEREERQAAALLSHPGESLNATADPSPALEHPGSGTQQIGADLKSDVEMSSGTLSTTLTARPASSPEGSPVDTKQRFHKVSLESETDPADLGSDSAGHSGLWTATESSRTDPGPPSPERWRQRYDWVRPRAEPAGVKSDFLSDGSTGSLSSLLSVLYTRHLTSSPSPLLPQDTPSFHGNAGLPSDGSEVQPSRGSEAGGGGEGRSGRDWAEPAAPAEETECQGESVDGETERRIKPGWDSQPPSISGFPPEDSDAPPFSGVFKATRVELNPDPASPVALGTPNPGSPHQRDMDNLVDTLKSMERPQRPRSMRGAPPSLFSSLPPIREDAPSSAPTVSSAPAPGAPAEAPNGRPVDLGIKWSTPKDMPSPLEMMKIQQQRDQQEQGQAGDRTRGAGLPLRASAISSIVMRRSSLGSDSSPECSPSPLLNGGGGAGSPQIPGSSASRLDNSFLFASYLSGSADQPLENGRGSPAAAQRSLFRTSSLPDIGLPHDRLSSAPPAGGANGNGLGTGNGPDPSAASRLDRFSFLMSPSPSCSSSLTGSTDAGSRLSRPPSFQHLSSATSGHGDPGYSPSSHLLSPTGSNDPQRPFSSEAYSSRFNQNLVQNQNHFQSQFHNQNQNQMQNQFQFHNQNQNQGMALGGSMGGVGGGGTPQGSPGLQRSFSTEGSVGGGGGGEGGRTPMFNSVHGGSYLTPEPEPERTQPKYRAFPDAYLTKEKEHGKLNPRPGKMFIFDRPGMCGQRIEVRSDVIDATPWQLQETISIRVVRGGWVLYEKPNFKGEKIALDEGDIELACPFSPPEEEEQQQQNGEKEQENTGQEGEEAEAKPAKRFIIGSVRRAVRDYSVPEICLFPEENAEGKKVTFRDTSEDARIFGFPIKANSIIINAGLWLVYAEPFFQGVPRVLEVGGFPNPAAWGVEQPYVGSLHPLKIGEPRVEKLNEPKLVIYDKPYFTGKTRTIYTNMRDFMTRVDRNQTAFMYSIASVKVQGGCWVGYEKEGFRGNQYLLEEGEYHDWRVWGGCNAELRSVRVIRADLTEPVLMMYEQPEDEAAEQLENTFEVTEAIPDVEMFGYRTNTRSIQVLSGAWIAYSHVDFSGDQFILEKGFYNNCADWGSQNNRICSVQPLLPAPSESVSVKNEVMLYTEPDFQGECHVCDRSQDTLSDRLLAKSCRVLGGSWVVYEGSRYTGNLYVLSEGDYPNFVSMGLPTSCVIRSLKPVPLVFSVPSISLFGLECLEGREITLDTEVVSMLEEGFNNHTLSVRVNSGCWVLCEHSNYRGRQFLLESIEIPNWPKYSQLHTIGSMFPVKQSRHFFRIKNKERGHFLSIQGGVEEMKSGRVVVTAEVEGTSDIWYYQEGLIKNKLSTSMSLQVMGNVEPGAKVVLWSETRQPVQTWSAQMNGSITSLNFPDMVLDIKGGKTYDKDHVVMMSATEERPCQQWELEIL